jgi:ribose transport system permease protein
MAEHGTLERTEPPDPGYAVAGQRRRSRLISGSPASGSGSRRSSPHHAHLLERAGELATRGSLLIVLAVLVVVFGTLSGSVFLSWSNMTEILSAQAATGTLALAVMVVMISGELELSVAAVMGTVSATVALLLTQHYNPLLAALIGLGMGAGFGLANGVLVVYVGIDSIIATLGTASVATGIGLAIVGPDTVANFPTSFLNFFTSTWGGVETCFYILLGIVALAVLVLQFTPMGRRFFFTGQNAQASYLLGIRVKRLKLGAFVAAGVLSAVAGVVLAAQSDSASVIETTTYLLPAYAAAFLSTAAIMPGRFNAVGVLIAAIILGTLATGLNDLAVPDWTTYVVDGGLLIIAIAFFTAIRAARDREGASRRRAAARDERERVACLKPQV